MRWAPVTAYVRTIAVAARLGFTHEATLRDAMQIGDGFEDDEIHALLVDGQPARRSSV